VSESSLEGLIDVFDVEPAGEGRFTGGSDPGGRQVIDGSQVLAQSIVAACKTLPAKSVRSARAVFFRPVLANQDIDFETAVLHDGRSFATCIVTASQANRACTTTTLLLDIPGPDVVRHPVSPPASRPDDAIPQHMPLDGREVRLVGVSDPNDPDEVGPPVLDAWVHYDSIPPRRDLAAALLAHFTGHLSISTTLRAHKGVGTAMSHRSISTGVLSIAVSFHEPILWDGWLLYSHESIYSGSGVTYVRGVVRTEDGRPLASFCQDALLRPMDAAGEARPADVRL
jgi:acyl-CoA thioesterase-2